MLPPGAEDIDYNGHLIEVRHFGAGWKAIIRRHGSMLAHSEIPSGPDRAAVIADAKAIVDKPNKP